MSVWAGGSPLKSPCPGICPPAPAGWFWGPGHLVPNSDPSGQVPTTGERGWESIPEDWEVLGFPLGIVRVGSSTQSSRSGVKAICLHL